MRDVFEFIGVTPNYEVANINEKFHLSTDKTTQSALVRRVEHPGLRRVLRPLLPARLTEPQPFEPPSLSKEDTRRLADTLRTDTERFRTLTGMRFEDWSV